MKHGITLTLAASALAMAAAAQAADDATEDSGPYFGAGVGEFNLEIDDFDDVTTTIEEYDSDDTAWRAFGGMRVNPYLGFEVAYINLGNPEDEILSGTFAEVETDGFAPYVVGTIPLGPFELFARGGYYFYDTKARVTSPLGTVRSSESGDDFTWSAGVGLTFFDRLNLKLEYEQFDFEDSDNANALWLTTANRF